MAAATNVASDQEPLQKERPGHGTDLPRKRKGCTGFTVCKALVLIYGIFFMLIGLLLLGMGIWIESIKKEYESINDLITSPSLLAIVVGITMIICAFAAIIGAINESLVLLKLFLAAVIIVFIIQVVIGIVAFVYREQTAGLAGQQLHFAIETYHTNEDVARAVDRIQTKYSCCGLSTPNDWENNANFSCSGFGPQACSLPSSCCAKPEQNCAVGIRTNGTKILDLKRKGINTTGCTWFFLMWVEEHLDYVGATALGFAIPQIVGIFLVYVFIQKVEDRKYLFKYRERIYAE